MIKFQKVNCVKVLRERKLRIVLIIVYFRRVNPFFNKIHRICNPCVWLFFSSLLPWEFIHVKLRKVVLSKSGLVVIFALFARLK